MVKNIFSFSQPIKIRQIFKIDQSNASFYLSDQSHASFQS